MNIIIKSLLILANVFGSTTQSAMANEPPPAITRDYDKLTSTITITSFRAGNHDDSGENDYFFLVKQYGLVNTKSERLKDLAERTKVEESVGEFGNVKLAALSYWRKSEEAAPTGEEVKDPMQLTITGQSIRELTARAMLENKLTEEKIAHMVEITLLERNKQFFFWGEDTVIAKTRYFPLPPTTFDVPERVDQQLQIQDDKGTIVKLTVKYEFPIVRQAADRASSK